MEWFRWYHGAISDPKWPIIARRSCQNIGTVVSVWAALLEYASQSSSRGSIDGFDPESVDALFGYEDGTADAVLMAMKKQGLVETPCNANETQGKTGVTLRLVSWEKRQVKREREDNSTARVRKYRQEKKSNNDEPLQAETPEKHHVTPPKRQETPRTEQNREDKRKTYTQEFELFWSTYPARAGKKQGKKEAFAEWKKAIADVPAGFLISQIEALAPQYGEYPVDASRWLKHRRWEDEATAAQSKFDNQFAGVI